MNILGAHIDSPRLDVKQNPLYEADGFAYLDTHYYGGIKKITSGFAQPLALHGVAVLKSGKTVPICVGEKGRRSGIYDYGYFDPSCGRKNWKDCGKGY